MTAYARFNVFAIVYGAAYMGLFLYNEFYQFSLFRYYPVLGRFHIEALPLETSGPAILWYSWLFGALVIALVAALIVPRSLADRLGETWVWAVPIAMLVLIIVYERRWFY